MRYQFPNGYGASVIDDGYGSNEGLLELAVIHDGQLCYRTPITSDVIGWLHHHEVQPILDAIAALPSNPYCVHRMRALA